MRLTVINQSTGSEAQHTLRWGRVVKIGPPRPAPTAAGQAEQLLVWAPGPWQKLGDWLWSRLRGRQTIVPAYPLQIDFVEHAVQVTNLGSSQPLYLLDQALTPQQPWLWLPEQALRYGDFILFWEAERSWAVGWPWQRVPLERVSRSLLLWSIFLVLILGLVGWLSLNQFWFRTARVESPTLTILPTLAATITETLTITGTPTITVITTPTVTATPRSTPTPRPTVARVVAGADVAATFTPTPTLTLLPAAATQAAAALVCVPTTPVPLAAELIALKIKIEPACVRVGEAYWQVSAVDWLDEAESSGRHHVFVYLQSDQPLKETITMAWETGSCTRPIVDAAGANCSMHGAGLVYQLFVNGLPSEQVDNLGLGTIDKRDWAIRTSYVVTFTRTVRGPLSIVP